MPVRPADWPTYGPADPPEVQAIARIGGAVTPGRAVFWGARKVSVSFGSWEDTGRALRRSVDEVTINNVAYHIEGDLVRSAHGLWSVQSLGMTRVDGNGEPTESARKKAREVLVRAVSAVLQQYPDMPQQAKEYAARRQVAVSLRQIHDRQRAIRRLWDEIIEIGHGLPSGVRAKLDLDDEGVEPSARAQWPD